MLVVDNNRQAHFQHKFPNVIDIFMANRLRQTHKGDVFRKFLMSRKINDMVERQENSFFSTLYLSQLKTLNSQLVRTLLFLTYLSKTYDLNEE